jgi:hypothetical protein
VAHYVSIAAVTNTPPGILERPARGQPAPERGRLASWVTGALERCAEWWRGRGASERLWWVVASAVVVAGLGAEVRVWASDRGFWGDEVYIADSLSGLGWGGMFGVLRHNQLAPPGWMVAEKLLFRTLGGDEHVLRLPALIGGGVVLVLTGVLAYKMVGRWAALLALALVATSPKILEYSGELKQYSVEAGAAMIVLLVTWLGLGQSGSLRERRRAVLISAAVLAGCGAVSYTAIIVLVGATAGAGLWLSAGRRWTDMWIVVGTATPGTLLDTAFILHRLASPMMAGQDSFFPNGLPPQGAGPEQLVQWLPTMWRGFVGNPLLWQYPIAVLLLVVGGLAALVVRGRGLWAAMLGATFGVAVVVAAVRAFPVEERVALYLVAPTVMLVVAGLDGAARLAGRAVARLRASWTSRAGAAGAAVAAGLVLAVGMCLAGASAAPAVRDGLYQARTPLYRDPFRDAMRDLAGRLRPGDAVLVYDFTEVQAIWYWRALGVPIAGEASMTTTEQCHPSSLTTALAGAHRVWYLKGAHFSQHPDDYQQRVASALQVSATFIEARDFVGYSSYPATVTSETTGWELFDLDIGPDPHPRQLPAKIAFACLDIERLPG